MEKTKQGLILSISLALVFIITVGLSYAYFSARLLGTENASTISLSGGIMEIEYSEDSNLIELYGIYPKEKEWFTKTITLKGTNTTDLEMNYKIGIEIEENTFSEGALTYSIKNTLNESGSPLEDIESTIIKTNGTQYIGYGYFNTVDKKEHQYELKIYFKNNGSEQNEDQKARFKGKIVVEEVLEEELITVTFNPEGGKLNTTTKKVLASGVYGELPEPTKEGYEFLGWNGKNMFNEHDWLLAISGAKYENDHYVFTFANAHLKYCYGGNKLPINNFKENTRYTLTVMGYVEECDNRCTQGYDSIRLLFSPNYSDSTYENYYFNNTIEGIKIFTTKENSTISYMGISYGTAGVTYAYITHVQLEEGATATAYEPYYITKDLNIVQNYDHTLKAIWKEI